MEPMAPRDLAPVAKPLVAVVAVELLAAAAAVAVELLAAAVVAAESR